MSFFIAECDSEEDAQQMVAAEQAAFTASMDQKSEVELSPSNSSGIVGHQGRRVPNSGWADEGHESKGGI